MSETVRSQWREAAGRDKAHYVFLPNDASGALSALGLIEGSGRLSTEAGESASALLRSVLYRKGFTVHDHLGDAPTTGYMVSLQGYEEPYPLQELEAAPEIIEAYFEEHEPIISQPGNYFGAWLHKGNVYLDVSRHFDNVSEALEAGREWNQLAIFDLSHGISISVPTGETIEGARVYGRNPTVVSDQVLAHVRDADKGI